MRRRAWMVAVLAAALALACASASATGGRHDHTSEEEGEYRGNFEALRWLPDGELERRVFFDGVFAKETSVAADGADGQRQGITLRQLARGATFMQLIFDEGDGDGDDGDGDGDALADCEVVRQRSVADDFVRAFKEDLRLRHAANATGAGAGVNGSRGDSATGSAQGSWRNATHSASATVRPLGRGARALPPHLRWLHFTRLLRRCQRRHRQLRHLAQLQRQQPTSAAPGDRFKRGISEKFIVPGTKWCGPHQTASRYVELGPLSKEDRCCRRHDNCKTNIAAFTHKYNMFNFRPFTISDCNCDYRQKRELLDLLRVPGTKWCGKGRSAVKYTQLGGFGGADKCCRVHDTACPFYIAAFEDKYGLFNWRINTIMHCACDERFRTCLKMSNTAAANLVGKLFFNVVQTKCFVLKPRKVCLRMSWWGKCQKYGVRKQAHLRNNVPY